MIGANQFKIKNLKLKILHFEFYIWNSKKGFTLIETLVALTLFSVVVTIASDLFLTFQRTNRRTESIQALVSDARFIMERMVREVREGMIDYTAYDGVGTINSPAALTQLQLRNGAGDPLQFRYTADPALCEQSVNPGCLILAASGSTERLTTTETEVSRAQFFIAPEADPFLFRPDTGQYSANIQPRVTIFLSLTNGRPAGERDYVRYDVQTTVSSRVYRR